MKFHDFQSGFRNEFEDEKCIYSNAFFFNIKAYPIWKWIGDARQSQSYYSSDNFYRVTKYEEFVHFFGPDYGITIVIPDITGKIIFILPTHRTFVENTRIKIPFYRVQVYYWGTLLNGCVWNLGSFGDSFWCNWVLWNFRKFSSTEGFGLSEIQCYLIEGARTLLTNLKSWLQRKDVSICLLVRFCALHFYFVKF